MQPIDIDGLTFNFQNVSIKSLPKHSLLLTNNSPRASYLLALLIGGVSISDENYSTAQLKNYMIVGAPTSSVFVQQNLERSFPDLREEIAGKYYFRSAKRSIVTYLQSQRPNHSLFSPLLNELSRAILNNNNGKGLSAFVHVYRAMESASYAFPLFYCRYEKEYLRVFNQLKEFFKGGELDFCNNFYQHLVKSDGLNGLLMQIDFKGRHSLKFVECMMADVSWVVDKRTQAMSITQLSSSSVEIKFEHCFDLIVRLRNGFFHHLSGSNSSIPSSVVQNADQFFEPINEIAIQVLGFMYGKIIRAHL